jgi:hypothetical protein
MGGGPTQAHLLPLELAIATGSPGIVNLVLYAFSLSPHWPLCPSAISSHQQQISSYEQQPQCSSALNPDFISLFVELQTLTIMLSSKP